MNLSVLPRILNNVTLKTNAPKHVFCKITEINVNLCNYKQNTFTRINDTNTVCSNRTFSCIAYCSLCSFVKPKPVSCTLNSLTNQHFSTALQNLQRRESLVLVPFSNPVLWMKMKWRFKKLNYFWDPEFKENEFLRGAKQAVVTITHLIGDNNFDDLKGLLTKEALQKLRQEVTLTWHDVLKQHIPLTHQHIKAITPFNIRMMENIKTGKRFCDIDALCIALKRVMYIEKSYHRILVFNILCRFHRNYSDGEIPNWTVAIFTMDVVTHKTTF